MHLKLKLEALQFPAITVRRSLVFSGDVSPDARQQTAYPGIHRCQQDVLQVPRRSSGAGEEAESGLQPPAADQDGQTLHGGPSRIRESCADAGTLVTWHL